MEHESTIPSQLSPVSTIPAALGSSVENAASDTPGIGGLLFKLALLAVTVGLTLYFAG